MSQRSSIEWTEATWNPVRGCTHVSPGCKNCYAERLAHRFSGIGLPYEGLTRKTKAGPKWTGGVALVEAVLNDPLHWRQPRRIFVNSMSDLFHPSVPESFISRVFDVMVRAPRHTFQILTKRADRLVALSPELPSAPNIWLGVSVESQAYASRIDALRRVDAGVRFLSLEPLLGPVPDLDLSGIHWVIVGGESGPGARAMDERWVLEIREECQRQHVPFFFKQWGGVRKSQTGRELEGQTWDEMPARPGRQARLLR